MSTKYVVEKYCEKCGKKCRHQCTEDGSYNETRCLNCGHMHTWEGGFLKSP
jgi:uncharacterized Zn finger protein